MSTLWTDNWIKISYSIQLTFMKVPLTMWVRKCLWRSPYHWPHNFSLRNTDYLIPWVSFGALIGHLQLFCMITEGKTFHIFFILWVRSAVLQLLWHPWQHCCMSHLPCCAPGNLVQGVVYLPLQHQIKGDPGTLKFTVPFALLHAQQCCSPGKIHRCDPGDTYLRQRLHCSVTWREQNILSSMLYSCWPSKESAVVVCPHAIS